MLLALLINIWDLWLFHTVDVWHSVCDCLLKVFAPFPAIKDYLNRWNEVIIAHDAREPSDDMKTYLQLKRIIFLPIQSKSDW